MLTVTHTTGTREQVWAAFRRAHDVRLWEPYHSILLLMDGKSCPEITQWLYRDEETMRSWVHAFKEAGKAWSALRSKSVRPDSPRRNGHRSKRLSAAVRERWAITWVCGRPSWHGTLSLPALASSTAASGCGSCCTSWASGGVGCVTGTSERRWKSRRPL